MTSQTEWVLGIIAVSLLATGIIYVTFSNDAKIRVDSDKSTFYVNLDGRWIVSGREYNKLFDGSSQMNRRTSDIKVETIIDEDNNRVIIKRTSPFIRGPVIVDTYEFDGNIDDITLFPISHKIEIFNGSGYFYRYEVRDLSYSGVTYRLDGETELTFGNNMKLNLHPNYRWAWVYSSGIVKVQYDLNSNYESFSMRLFDPIQIANTSTNFQYGFCDNCTANSTGIYFNNLRNDSVYNSQIFDAGSQINWRTINWSCSLNGVTYRCKDLGLNVSIQTRTFDNYTFDTPSTRSFLKAGWYLNDTVDPIKDILSLSNGTMNGTYNPFGARWLVNDNKGTLFNGTNDYITVNYTEALNISVDATIAFWFRSERTMKQIVGTIVDRKNEYQVYITNEGVITARIWNGSSYETVTTNPARKFNDGQWHSGFFTIDVDTRKMGLYIDNVMENYTFYAGRM